MERQITKIEVSKLIPNPNNPRKDIGDISELTESIKSQGIMQNLTVMKTSAEEYMVLIGHRRLSAAKAAGFTTVPCMIIDELPVSEQVGIMLLENLQRNDLTIPEQAQSFQMMLDLGDTVEGIAEKTGFAKSTIHHRVNIAKLDQDVLNEKIHQLNLKDLIALEQVSDINKRNEILEKAYDSQDIARKANEAAKEEKRNKAAEKVYEELKKQGLEPLPKELETYRWSYKLQQIQSINLEDDDKDNVVKGIEDGKKEGQQVYFVKWPYATTVSIVYMRPEKEEEEEEEETPEQIERRRISENIAKVKDIEKRLKQEREDFLHGVISGKIEDKHTLERMKYLWTQLMKNRVDIDIEYIYDFCFGEDDERPEYEKENYVMNLSPCLQMLILFHLNQSWRSLINYHGEYNEDVGNYLSSMYQCLEEYGFTLEEEDSHLIYGNSKLYEKEKE